MSSRHFNSPTGSLPFASLLDFVPFLLKQNKVVDALGIISVNFFLRNSLL